MPPAQPGLRRFLFFLFSFPAFFSSSFLFSAGGPAEDSTLTAEGSYTRNLFLRRDIIEHSRHFLGISYRYGGRSPETGFDCSGFTAHVMGLFDVALSPSSRLQALQGREVALQAVRPGDLITFRRSRKRAVSHVAMVVDNNEEGIFIIHSTSRGVVIDNLSESRYWRPKVFEARDVLTDIIGQPPLPERELLILLKRKLLPLSDPLLEEAPLLPPLEPEMVENRKMPCLPVPKLRGSPADFLGAGR